jgi:eukaryotic-like serine/threonine-protein kinase
MRPDRRQVLALLDEALQTPPEARPALLDSACRDDAELRREVEALLALETAADGFLADPVPLGTDGPGFPSGTRIGPYRIVELLGRGGMGTVYRAAREDDFTKQVALKLVQHERISPFTLRRFHLERQILARLEHPNIARLLDGGTTEDGRPYLVMEHVEGVPIDRYCEERQLTTVQRLGLCLQVASALSSAHQNLVVHRDLKPGNILVTGDGVPKLLDFGIAKLLDPIDEPANATRTTERMMTPRYASPEQVRGEPVTPASDLYSLGVLLYQLLTGRLPCGLDTCTLP